MSYDLLSGKASSRSWARGEDTSSGAWTSRPGAKQFVAAGVLTGTALLLFASSRERSPTRVRHQRRKTMPTMQIPRESTRDVAEYWKRAWNQGA
jgi:HAMP domain-containing protein